MTLRLATADDAAAVAAIYAPYVTESAVSFETEAPDAAAMRARIEGGGGLYPWLVVCDAEGGIEGYAYASAFRPRPAYRFTVEVTVYVRPQSQGRKIGHRLYRTLFELLIAQGFTQAIAAITMPNPASERLHRAHGFVEAGIYRDVGYKLDAWRSVALWQRPLAKMSTQPSEPCPVSEVWCA